MEHHTNSQEETAALAEQLAGELQPGDVVLLHGTLGMGKTVFARALIRTLTGNPGQDVPSPTFTLLQTYDSAKAPVYHYDLYRLEDPDEILELGWEDALAEGIVLIEWPEKLGPYKPAQTLDITLSKVDNNPSARQILIQRP